MSLETLNAYLEEIRKTVPDLNARGSYEIGLEDLLTPNAGKYPLLQRLRMKTENLGGAGYGINFAIPFAIAVARNGFDPSIERRYPAFNELDVAERQAAEILTFSLCSRYERLYVGQKMDYFEMGLVLNDQYRKYCVDTSTNFTREILDLPRDGKAAYVVTNVALIILEAVYADHGRC